MSSLPFAFMATHLARPSVKGSSRAARTCRKHRQKLKIPSEGRNKRCPFFPYSSIGPVQLLVFFGNFETNKSEFFDTTSKLPNAYFATYPTSTCPRTGKTDVYVGRNMEGNGNVYTGPDYFTPTRWEGKWCAAVS